MVRKINNAFIRADQIHHAEGKDDIDWFAPIVADAEAGFGGVLNAHELMKHMIEAGAAGVHFEDQLASAKKCGHMGGKVLVPTQEAVQKLIAARLAADLAGVPTVLFARTDAEAANLVTSDFDENDKPFLTGERTAEGFFRTRNGLASGDLARAGLRALRRPDLVRNRQAGPRISRAASPKASTPCSPDKMLAYNCSPSFNWKKNLDDATIAKFQRELGAMGYKFQFITLAGFHALNYSMFDLAHGYARDNMTRLRQAAGSRVRRRVARLHRHQAPARGRHRLLRRDHPAVPGRQVVRDGADRLDRRRAVRVAPQYQARPQRGRASATDCLLTAETQSAGFAETRRVRHPGSSCDLGIRCGSQCRLPGAICGVLCQNFGL